jgi:hypothetical protein
MKKTRFIILCVTLITSFVSLAFGNIGYAVSQITQISDESYAIFESVGITRDQAEKIGSFRSNLEYLITNEDVTTEEARHIAEQLIDSEPMEIENRDDYWNSPVPLQALLPNYLSNSEEASDQLIINSSFAVTDYQFSKKA